MVERDGEVVAALICDRSLDDDPELVEAVGGAAEQAGDLLLAMARVDLAEVLCCAGNRTAADGPADRRRPA